MAKFPPLEAAGPGLPREQVAEQVVPPLGLKQPVAIDDAAFAYHAVHRAGDGFGIGADRAGARFERAREEFVEAGVTVRIGLRRFVHVDGKQGQKATYEQVLEPGGAHPCRGQHQTREPMLGQNVLQPYEQGGRAGRRQDR